MERTFTAPRISDDNVVFPPTIIFNDEGVTIKNPHLLHHETTFIPYEAISSIDINTPLVGFSTIFFYAYGKMYKVHGFYKSEVQEMKSIVENR